MAVLLLLKGFFSGSEIAMVNADKVKLSAMAGKGHRGSRMVLDEFRSPETLLGTTLGDQYRYRCSDDSWNLADDPPGRGRRGVVGVSGIYTVVSDFG